MSRQKDKVNKEFNNIRNEKINIADIHKFDIDKLLKNNNLTNIDQIMIDPPDPEKEGQITLIEIQNSYNQGLKYYEKSDLKFAEQEFVKVLKPMLSKPSMQSKYISIENCKDKLLNSMYYLGQIYLKSDKYLNHYAKAAAIFQYCHKFSEEYKVKRHDDNNIEINFLKEAYLIEEAFLNSINKAANASNEYLCIVQKKSSLSTRMIYLK